jgi:hypothetical protein
MARLAAMSAKGSGADIQPSPAPRSSMLLEADSFVTGNAIRFIRPRPHREDERAPTQPAPGPNIVSVSPLAHATLFDQTAPDRLSCGRGSGTSGQITL